MHHFLSHPLHDRARTTKARRAAAPAAADTASFEDHARARATLSRMPSLFRFSVPLKTRPELRVSQNGRIVLDGKKLLYAHEETIAESNNALSKVAGGKGGYLRLEAVGPAPEGHPELKRVAPKWVGRKGRLPEYMGELSEMNTKSGAQYMSHADCHMTAQTIMGSTDEPSGIANTEHAVVGGLDAESDDRTTRVAPIAKYLTEGKISDHGANRVLDAFLIKALPLFAGRLEAAVANRPKIDDPSPLPDVFATTAAGIRAAVDEAGTDVPDQVKKLRLQYRRIVAHPHLAHMFGMIFKINEYVDPKIGQALAQFNDETERKAEESKSERREAEIKRRKTADPSEQLGPLPEVGKDLWNFHWAGVVMKDGGDYVTLENLSVELTSVKNTDWYFAMYGTGEQSFHSEARKDSHVGDFPLTLPFEAVR